MAKNSRSALAVIFTTVAVDLIGFGIVIPLVAIYGEHFGATALELSIMGAIYSIMQFFFAPIWGRLSDQVGRRPILLMSLTGSTISYLIFAFSPSVGWLIFSRFLGGVFAANLSTAQAYVADVTEAKDRAKGMGLIGAAFGIGFTLGPPLGGIAAQKLGLWAPGVIASAICGLNLLLAFIRLPESLTPSAQRQAKRRSSFDSLKKAWHSHRRALFFSFFLATFAFSMMEQVFSLLFQHKFDLATGDAGYKTGLVLMWSGILGILIQGGLIRRLVPKYGEQRLVVWGLFFNLLGMAIFPWGPNYGIYFLLVVPIALGSGFFNPSLYSLISKNADAAEQGETMGISQALGSLARAVGPFLGLLVFSVKESLPFILASGISLLLFIYWSKQLSAQKRSV